MSFSSCALRIAAAIGLSLAAASITGCVLSGGDKPVVSAHALAHGQPVVTQVGPTTFHYVIATAQSGKADADRDKVLRDAAKLAAAMGAGGYEVVRESSHTVGDALVRHVDIKLNGRAAQTASRD